MFERFTDRARRVVVLAQEEARLLNHNYIGTEHILLGLIHEGEGVAAKALESLGISLEGVRGQVEELIGQGGSSPTGTPATSDSSTVNGTTFASGYSVSELDADDGDIIYIENRAPITRATDQTENIKLIVEF